jgi:DnaJ-class molecular chaperone
VRDLALVLAATACCLLYAASLYIWPFAPCRKCGGSGTNRGSNQRRFGVCRRCGGTRRRRRIGAAAVHQLVTSTKTKGWRK